MRKGYIVYVVCFFVFIFFVKCTHKGMKIEKLNLNKKDNKGSRVHYYVISNFINNRDSILNLVNEYNFNNKIDTGLNLNNYRRVFFRKTSVLNKDYVENDKGYFDHDFIEDHGEDIVFKVEWSLEDSVRMYYYFYDDKGSIQGISECENNEIVRKTLR